MHGPNIVMRCLHNQGGLFKQQAGCFSMSLGADDDYFLQQDSFTCRCDIDMIHSKLNMRFPFCKHTRCKGCAQCKGSATSDQSLLQTAGYH